MYCCKRVIIQPDREAVTVGLGWDKHQLCLKCAQPVVTFMRCKELLPDKP